MIETEKIIQELNKRFAEPLKEFYTRRIIFWKDEEREYEDKLEGFELENAKLVILKERNQFAVKKLIACDEPNSNLLIYTNVTHEDLDDDWLLDAKLYGEEYHSDLLSQIIDEMGMSNEQPVREAVRLYRDTYFKSKAHRNKVASLSINITKAGQVHLAVLSCICGQKDARPESIIRAVLNDNLSTEKNELYQSICKFKADNAFWGMVAQVTGYQSTERNLLALAAHILLTAATQTMASEYLAGLDDYIAPAYKAHCYDLVAGWMNQEGGEFLFNIATQIEDEMRLPQRFMKLDVDDIIDTECFPCIDEIILTKLMTEITDDHIINVDTIQNAIEKRRTSPWYSRFVDFYDGLIQVSNMQDFFSKKFEVGFHTVEPAKVWEEYTSSYYLMDTFYRLFHCAYSRIRLTEYHGLEELFKKVVKKVEGIYSGWFLAQLSQNWATACEEDMKNFGHTPSVKQQKDFYKRYVANSNTKTFVVISDGLRYEVAKELVSELERDTHGKISIESCEAIFPAVTHYGMAALLPHGKLSVEATDRKQFSVLADGIPTSSNYREKVLQNANPNSVAIQYSAFSKMGKDERAAFSKGKDVLYIYHNSIDKTGHSSEDDVFSACQTAVKELKKLVKDITNDCNGIRILITADHGFLYTHAPLTADSKISKDGFRDDIVECDRRYVLVKSGAKVENLMPVKFLDGDTGYDGYAPKENIRIMTAGSQNYVHGGISLQELVVPIITYHHVRAGGVEYLKNIELYKTEPVEIGILSSGRKVSNMIFNLDFYQKEAVGGKKEPATYRTYFVDNEGKPVSDVQKIIADKSSDDVKERKFRLTFNLKPSQYLSTKTYFLVIENETGKAMPEKIPFQIDIAFAFEQFNFGAFD